MVAIDVPPTVWGCAITSDGSLLATAATDATVRLWDTATGLERAVFNGPHNRVALSPDGILLATASGRRIEIWDIAETRRRSVLTGAVNVSHVAFSPDRTRLASAGPDGVVRIWDLDTEACLCGIRVGTSLEKVSWHPDGKSVCAVGLGGAYLLAYQQ